MWIQKLLLVFSFAFIVVLIGCGNNQAKNDDSNNKKTETPKTDTTKTDTTETDTTKTDTTKTDTTKADTTKTENTEKSGNPLATPKESLSHQLSLLKAGDYEKMKACLTVRQQKNITEEKFRKASKEASKMTMEELYDKEIMGEFGGNKTCKIKMKNGRSLTTLVLVDGKWLADTLWFK